MARVTVEDCVLKVPNRFELVLLAAQRAREISSGVPLSIDRDDDKNPVVALREIADETVGLPHLKESLVRGMQKQVELDEPEEEPAELEVDPSMFALAAAGPALLDEDGEADAELDELDDEDEISEEEAAAPDPAFAADDASLAEELAEDDLAVEDDLAGAEEDDLAGAEEEDIAGAGVAGETAGDDLPGEDDEEL